ncbi:MAG: response regulator transcription factor [Proteobacteria bacterium]|nr:response regulator transcription factor [Pseudomonadota bacterium]MBU1641203.1 response regulator transcription factor [Pseudomonadota bacterium]
MGILLVEDDLKIASLVEKGLSQAGFTVDHVGDGEEGLAKALDIQYDAAIIDIMLPGLDGLSLIQQMRREQINIPVLVLSAKRTVDDRVKGLQMGGDDYLTKPFAFSELLARLQALLRRSAGKSEPVVLHYDDLTVDLLSHEVFRGPEKLDIQPREFDLLAYLVRNAERVVSKTMIMEQVWGYNFDPQTNVVEARMCRLRNKIEKPHGPKLIQTIRGVGYVLKKSS